jgi:HSP20 family protein
MTTKTPPPPSKTAVDKSAPIKRPAKPQGPDVRHPLLALRTEMDRLFDEFFDNWTFRRPHFDLEPFRRIEERFASLGKMTPHADVAETAKGFKVAIELPGMTEKDIAITADEGRLVVKGEKKEESRTDEDNFHLTERRYGSFLRTFPLPDSANLDKAKATFKDGVLSIDIPKKALAKSKAKAIPIK